MKRKWPRSVRGAKRRGWTVVVPNYDPKILGNTSFLGLCIWADRNTQGKYVSSFSTTEFAFELESDAGWFSLKWT